MFSCLSIQAIPTVLNWGKFSSFQITSFIEYFRHAKTDSLTDFLSWLKSKFYIETYCNEILWTENHKQSHYGIKLLIKYIPGYINTLLQCKIKKTADLFLIFGQYITVYNDTLSVMLCQNVNQVEHDHEIICEIIDFDIDWRISCIIYQTLQFHSSSVKRRNISYSLCSKLHKHAIVYQNHIQNIFVWIHRQFVSELILQAWTRTCAWTLLLPGMHIHLYSPFISRQVPSFWQGLEAHSLMFTSQYWPENPVWQIHLKLPGVFSQVLPCSHGPS